MLYYKVFLSFLFLVALTGYMSCSKDDPEPAIAAEGTMIASVNGVNWITEEPTGIIFQGQISITGIASDRSKIVIYINGDAEGKYNISGVPTALHIHVGSFTPGDVSAGNPVFVSTNIDPGPAGEIEITEIDETNKTVSATFSFKAARSVPTDSIIEITRGSFTKIPYSDVPGVLAGNSFSFNVHGSAFSPLQLTSSTSSGQIFINAVGAGGRTLSLRMPASITTGTFNFGVIGSTQYATFIDNNTTYGSTSGTLQITKHDADAERIEGTFSFEAELYPAGGGNIDITEGSFKVKY